ncbi:HIT family protein [Microbacterium sp. W4I20]|uniref:HIT family protein n=1 Tax=Microbacterium sp. W4I20 TaxID=3042262 RepID=UPI00277FE158|nr:HIT family protein [Microbacterium sp. W4I20]MDQ0726486.1 diadenosine tetraphosphate (Ap4A) HIT family hydrolase [Microbacterium sp. W4I20]
MTGAGQDARAWWSDEEWATLTNESDCGMCADAHLDENPHSILVGSTATTHTRLARNQAHPGYSLVILREHVTDLVELEPATLEAFWSDVQRAGRAITAVFAPRKIDYLVMGHRMPHLHCHLLPQHPDDDPLRNGDISDGPIFPSAEALARDAQALWKAWGRG